MKRRNITADGRDLTKEEWRVIPEFPKYEVTSDGDVRHKETHMLLAEQVGPRGGHFYTLWGKDNKSYSRGFWGLIYSAFPEIRPVEEWWVIPDHPQYQINKEGVVRVRKSQRLMKIHITPFCNIPYVQLTTDGVQHTIKISDLTGTPDVKCEHAA